MFSIYFLIMIFSIDNFLVCISYSIKKINISLKHIFLMCLINTLAMFLSLSFANVLTLFIPNFIFKFITFIMLFSLGIYNMFEDSIKKYFYIKKRNKFLNVYLDETSADFDNSKSLSVFESVILSLVLSLDSLVGGFSISLFNISITNILVIVFSINLLFFILGKYLGKYLNKYIDFNLSYFCGFIIILIALLNFI